MPTAGRSNARLLDRVSEILIHRVVRNRIPWTSREYPFHYRMDERQPPTHFTEQIGVGRMVASPFCTPVFTERG
ncbi:MAG: hypothetical protein NZM29_01965 [Nitrospira sp.]|nr:hypothetical protein [Nitrospira sp.]